MSSFFERMRPWWLDPQAVGFSPARLVVTVTVAIAAFRLGHNYLESGEDQQALMQYDKVLQVQLTKVDLSLAILTHKWVMLNNPKQQQIRDR